jgi:hypothetical protein
VKSLPADAAKILGNASPASIDIAALRAIRDRLAAALEAA